MGQIVAFDTPVFVYYFEEHRDYADIAEDVLLPVISGDKAGVFSIIGLLELLVKPKQSGEYILEDLYKSELATFPNLQIINLDMTIIDKAAEFRATYGLRTPDAIHIATAVVNGASEFITNDRGLKRVKEIKVRLLSDARPKREK